MINQLNKFYSCERMHPSVQNIFYFTSVECFEALLLLRTSFEFIDRSLNYRSAFLRKISGIRFVVNAHIVSFKPLTSTVTRVLVSVNVKLVLFKIFTQHDTSHIQKYSSLSRKSRVFQMKFSHVYSFYETTMPTSCVIDETRIFLKHFLLHSRFLLNLVGP